MIILEKIIKLFCWLRYIKTIDYSKNYINLTLNKFIFKIIIKNDNK